MAGKTLDQLLADLRQQRDELRLQMHLAKAEARDEWDAIEKRWQQVESRLGRAADEAKSGAQNVGAALEQVAEEIGSAYRRIRESLR
jgi:chromosome segregation ATPase